MVKKYTAKSEISVNIKVNGHARHVCFTPVTDGGSNYYTSDEAEQKALESHYRYGSLFRGEEVVEVVKPEKTVVDEEDKVTEIAVSCIDDAKDYLSDKYNESRTRMRSKKAVIELANKHKVRFVGGDFGDFDEKKEEQDNVEE